MNERERLLAAIAGAEEKIKSKRRIAARIGDEHLKRVAYADATHYAKLRDEYKAELARLEGE